MKKHNKEKIEKNGDGFFKKLFRPAQDKLYDCQVAIHKLIGNKHKQSSQVKSNYKKWIFYSCWMAIPLLQLLIFYFVVNINSIALAFQQYDMNTGTFHWVGFENFRTLFYNLSLPTDPLRIAIKNSIILFFFETGVGVSLALIFSYYIYKKQFASEFFRIILFLPQIVSTIVMVILFKYFTDYAVPSVLNLFFGVEISPKLAVLTNPSTRFGAIVFFSIWCGFGTNVLMYVSAMTRIPVEITEAASLDGITPIREFIQIVLPLIYPTISAFLIIGMTNIFISQAYLYEIYGSTFNDQKLYTIGFYLFRYVLESEGYNNYAYAAAGGLVATCVATPITLTVKTLLEKIDPNTEG